jgi:hypothetical protein
MPDEPTITEAEEPTVDTDVEGHRVGHPGGHEPQLRGDDGGSPDGVKFDDTEQDVEGHKK